VLALAVAGGGALIAPIQAKLPRGLLVWTAVPTLGLVLFERRDVSVFP